MLKEINLLHQQAQAHLNKAEYKQAHHCLIQILQQDKYFADAYFLLAMIATAHHNLEKSIALIKQASVLSPKKIEYYAHLAKAYVLQNNHVEAKKQADIAQNLKSSSALTWDTIGGVYSKVGLHKLAAQCFEKAVEKDNKNAEYFFNLGASQKFIGSFDLARKSYNRCIALAPAHCKAHAALTSLGEISQSNNHISTLKALNASPINSDNSLYIGHALAREFEALKDYQSAFEYLRRAKKQKLTELNYSINSDKAMFCEIKHYFEKPNLNQSGFDSDEALFVVGMPRTGTTLVERILSQHSDVTSAGELQHFGLLLKKMSNSSTNRVIDAETVEAASKIDFAELGKSYIASTRAVTGNTAKFVDKMPLNVLYAGFILQALPKAKIVCLDRDPLDTIVSNFRQLFAVNYSYYNYAYDLTTTAEFYLFFKNLMQTWQRLFPENFYIVNYEKLVNDPETEAKKVIDFCGLSWQEACLEINKNTAPVATASAVQVRSAINNKSVGNWKKYNLYLDTVKDILAKSSN
jgi:tetratricopeptide (TPR) repeat protein